LIDLFNRWHDPRLSSSLEERSDLMQFGRRSCAGMHQTNIKKT
jgi:hypothetical protein